MDRARHGTLLTQDPIGLAGGVNVYAYAGNNPITYVDPFGLDSVQVGCRKVVNSAGTANHCAVRVFDANDNARIGELLNQGDTNAVVVFGGDDSRADKYEWTTLTSNRAPFAQAPSGCCRSSGPPSPLAPETGGHGPVAGSGCLAT